MNSRIILALAAVMLLAVQPAHSQESHLEIRYDKSSDHTLIRSDLLYVINTPSHFLEIQLVGRYRGKGKPSQTPDRLNIEFSSFGLEPSYQPDEKHQLKINADDQVIDFGLLTYSRIDEEGRPEKDQNNPKALPSNFGFGVSLPSTALVSQARKSHALTFEMMSVSALTIAELKSLAAANDVVMRLGDDVFRLTPIQLTILREFAASIAPAESNTAATTVNRPESLEISPSVPSDQNQMRLAETLSWMKSHLDRNAATKDIMVPRRVEPMSFKTCKISYRVVPLVRTTAVSQSLVYAIFEYQIDLADLNPEAIGVAEMADYSMVMMATRDYKPKIKVYKRANDGGSMGRTLEDGLSESATINLKNKQAALEFRVALKHAINLCHPSP